MMANVLRKWWLPDTRPWNGNPAICLTQPNVEREDSDIRAGRECRPRYSVNLYLNTLLVDKFLFFLALCWLPVSCSSLRIPQGQRIETVHLTEAQQVEYESDFIEATKLKLFGNLADAASRLTRCTEVNPYDGAAYFQLAEIYSAVDDRENALKNARLSVRYDTGNIWYKMQLASLYVLNEHVDSAITVYRQIMDLQPDNSDLRLNAAMLYLEKSDFRQALKEIDKIEKVYGFTEEVAVAKYRVYSRKRDAGPGGLMAKYRQQRNIKATESLLLESIEAFPDELQFLGLLAELYSSAGKEEKAREYYEKLLNADPENALGYISMIMFYRDYGNEEKAIEEMRRMYGLKNIEADYKAEVYLTLSSDSTFFNRHHREMDAMLEQLSEKHPDNMRIRIINADRNLRAGNHEAAKDDLLFITGRVQTNYFLWEQLFFLLNRLQDHETLYEQTGKALKYFDDRSLFHFFHGLSASLLKKYDEAILSYRRVLECLKKEKAPDKEVELQTYVMLGEAYNEQKRYPESDEVFDRALAMEPNNPLILNNYSYYLSLREEKLDMAEKYIRRCIALEPNSSTYLDTYGWILYKLGRIDEAIAMIEKAMENGGSDNPEIADHMCELLVVSGQADEAYHICKYAIELNNSRETVEQKIESIKKQDEGKKVSPAQDSSSILP
jgi:tetratricopeptide (TPR) repeat protein